MSWIIGSAIPSNSVVVPAVISAGTAIVATAATMAAKAYCCPGLERRELNATELKIVQIDVLSKIIHKNKELWCAESPFRAFGNLPIGNHVVKVLEDTAPLNYPETIAKLKEVGLFEFPLPTYALHQMVRKLVDLHAVTFEGMMQQAPHLNLLLGDICISKSKETHLTPADVGRMLFTHAAPTPVTMAPVGQPAQAPQVAPAPASTSVPVAVAVAAPASPPAQLAPQPSAASYAFQQPSFLLEAAKVDPETSSEKVGEKVGMFRKRAVHVEPPTKKQ